MKTNQKVTIIFLVVIILIEILVFTKIYKGPNTEKNDSNQNNSLTSEEKYMNLTFISYDQFKELYKSGNKFIVVLVQTSCGYCLQYKPILNEVAKENNIPIYILDILKMSDDEIKDLITSIEYLEENPSWGTPITFVIEKGITKGVLPGFVTKEATVQFYQEQGLIN